MAPNEPDPFDVLGIHLNDTSNAKLTKFLELMHEHVGHPIKLEEIAKAWRKINDPNFIRDYRRRLERENQLDSVNQLAADKTAEYLKGLLHVSDPLARDVALDKILEAIKVGIEKEIIYYSAMEEKNRGNAVVGPYPIKTVDGAIARNLAAKLIEIRTLEGDPRRALYFLVILRLKDVPSDAFDFPARDPKLLHELFIQIARYGGEEDMPSRGLKKRS